MEEGEKKMALTSAQELLLDSCVERLNGIVREIMGIGPQDDASLDSTADYIESTIRDTTDEYRDEASQKLIEQERIAEEEALARAEAEEDTVVEATITEPVVDLDALAQETTEDVKAQAKGVVGETKKKSDS